MFSAILALCSSALYGAGDFFGGLSARRAKAITVVLYSQLVGLAVLLCALPFLPPARPTSSDIWAGAGAGVAGMLGVGLLYSALASGRMSVAAPITAVCGISIPVLAGFALGERVTGRAMCGIGLAAASVALISYGADSQATQPASSSASQPKRAIRLALGSGIAIGAFYVCLGRTSANAGAWPVVVARSVSVGLLGLMAIRSPPILRLSRTALSTTMVAGIFDVAANFLYSVAARGSLLGLTATLASLYPATTVLLARVVLKERMQRPQTIGLVVAAAAIVLMTS
jgi:drug/metabolite transporter (DMT)-like permease